MKKKTIEKDDLCETNRLFAEKIKYLAELLVWLNQDYGTTEIKLIEKGAYSGKERTAKIEITDLV